MKFDRALSRMTMAASVVFAVVMAAPAPAGAAETGNRSGASASKASKTGQGSQNTLFILDASGSMWGQINGTPKIAIAKSVMKKLVPELPDNARIGLIAYGHRRKGDCNDVETLVKLGAHHKQALLTAVAGLSAKGKTPLTRSVNQAIAMLRGEENASTVVLVSDGIESCGGDPCAAVKAAQASGVKFVLHTVGFGLTKHESEQLRCMAKAGNGRYFEANDAEALLKSARSAVQAAGILKLTAIVNGAAANLSYRVEDAKTEKVIRQTVLAAPSGGAIRLADGHYKVFVLPAGVHGAREQTVDVTIKSGETLERILNFDKGTLKLTVTVNGKPAHALVHIENPASHKWIYQSSVFGVDTPVNIDLAVGKVDVVVQAGGKDVPELRVKGVEIVAGKTTDRVIPITVDGSTITTDANGMEQNSDRPGRDLRHFSPANDDPALCQKACQGDDKCKAWTYVKPNTIQGPKPNCWLKEAAPQPHHNTCCVSGVRLKSKH